MGYTHYWTPSNKPIPETHLKAIDALLRDGFKEALVDDQEGNAPDTTDQRVWFNGVDEDAHETFAWICSGKWAFCKTAHKPYDRQVCAVLLILHHAGCLETLSSDGMAKQWKPEYRTHPCEPGWNAGALLAQKYLPEIDESYLRDVALGTDDES